MSDATVDDLILMLRLFQLAVLSLSLVACGYAAFQLRKASKALRGEDKH